jgi:Phosphate/sulphate permeases
MHLSAIALFVVAGLASLFMAWVIGAGSSGATPFAPAVGANAIPTMQAAFLVGLLGLAGAVTQGAAVSATIGDGLIGGVEIPAVGVIVVLLVGAGLMAIGIRRGIRSPPPSPSPARSSALASRSAGHQRGRPTARSVGSGC